jgi:integrase
MPRLVHRDPKLCLHKKSGLGYLKLNGRRVYLGRFGTSECSKNFKLELAKWELAGRVVLPLDSLTVVEMIAKFREHSRSYYIDSNGSPTGESDNYDDALVILKDLWGRLPLTDFKPSHLKLCRQAMLERDWSRNYLNRQVDRIRSAFKWAVAESLCPPHVYDAIKAVAGFRRGRSKARETDPVKPVAVEIVKATLPFLTRPVKGLVEFQLLTGCRPHEACDLRGCDIITKSKPWTYKPPEHKTVHLGKQRTIYLGPQARAIVEKFLKPNPQTYLFSPADALAELRARRTAARETPPHQGNRPGSNKSRRPRRAPREHYTTDSYRRAVARACEMAFKMPDDIREVKADRPAEGDSPEQVTDKERRCTEKRIAREKWHDENVWHRAPAKAGEVL